MKKLLSLGVSSDQDRPGNEGLRERFIGAWRLAWLEEQGADGKIHRADCTGLLVFTRDGHMSVQVMFKNPPAETNAAPVQYAQGGYEASFGKYEVDEGARIFTFHVEGALVRTLIGKDLPRAFGFSGKQLIVKSTRGILESCLGTLLGRLGIIAPRRQKGRFKKAPTPGEQSGPVWCFRGHTRS